MNKNAIIVIAVIVVVAAGAWIVTKNKAQDEGTSQTQATSSAPAATTSTSAPAVNGLKIEDVKVGTGAEAAPGKEITVHYTGTLTNGTKFDSSKDRNVPFTFRLSKPGVSEPKVIQGWDQGLLGMKVGGVRKLTIPPEMAYGPRAVGPIPPNSTLLFEVEMLDVKD